LEVLGCEEKVEEDFGRVMPVLGSLDAEMPRDVRFHGSLSYATSPYANMLSALGGL
jgi:hypothetical protein